MNGKVVVNLSTGLEDQERVIVAFLVGAAALEQGKDVVFFLTKEAVRLTLPGVAQGEACTGCPPLERVFAQVAEQGGQLYACPFCVASRGLNDAQLVENARVAGATPLWEWVGDGATVFSY
jgi:predicted peroxiredoxin